MHSYELGMWKGYHFSIEGIRKLIRKQSYLKLKIKILIANVFQSKMFHQTMFFSFSKLYIYQPRDIFVWHKRLFCHLPAIHWAISSLPVPCFAMTWDLKSKLYLTSGLLTLPDNPGDLTWDFEPFLPVSRLESEIACSRLRDSRARGIEKARKRKKREETGERGRRRKRVVKEMLEHTLILVYQLLEYLMFTFENLAWSGLAKALLSGADK